MTTYRLMDGAAGRPGNGPAAAAPYGGNLVVGTMFDVTQGGLWLEGYWWWVAATGQDTAAGQVFCLRQLSDASSGVLVPGSTVTAGALSAGAWNHVPLTVPLLLTPCGSNAYGAVYLAATGKVFTTGFPETKNQFGSAQPYSAGIMNGPLTAPSSSGGSAPAGGAFSWTKPQCPFSTAGSDPTTTMPGANDSDANLWLDIQVSDVAPAGASYRGFPSSPAFVAPGTSAQSLAYTIGLHFTVSRPCALTRIWHYSPSGATVLPTRTGVWDVATHAVVAGTDNMSPSWSGAAASGWISTGYSGSGVVLQPGHEYIASVFTSDNADPWFLAFDHWWGGSPGPFASGITAGPLTVLGNAAANPGQDSWNVGITWTYPSTSTSPEFDGLDVEVTPVPSGSGAPLAAWLAAGVI